MRSGEAGLLGLMLPAEFRRRGSRTTHIRGRYRDTCRSGRIGRDGLSHAHVCCRDDRRGPTGCRRRADR